MKILKFNESVSEYYDHDLYGNSPKIKKSANLSPKEYTYIDSFVDSIEALPLEWKRLFKNQN